MFGYYNEQQIRKAIVAFGSLFSHIFVQRRNSDGRQVSAPFLVPIRYSPGGKTYIASRERPDVDRDDPSAIFHRSVPRMGFEMTGMSLAPERQKNRGNAYTFGVLNQAGNTDMVTYKEAVSIVLDMSLYVLAENNSDLFTIIEQILPYFKPAIPVEIVGDPFPCNFTSMLKLTGVSVEDNYEGDVGEIRQVIAELSFEMEFMLFAGVEVPPDGVIDDDFRCLYDIENMKTGTYPIINKVIVDLFANEVNFVAGTPADERVIVKAIPDGVLSEEDSTGTETIIDDDPQ